MEEDYKGAIIEGKYWDYITNIFKKYFDSSGYELEYVLQANDYHYKRQELATKPSPSEFYKDKEMIIWMPIQIINKYQALAESEDYLITSEKQEAIVLLLYEFYSYNYYDSLACTAFNDTNYADFYERIRPDMLRIRKFIHTISTYSQKSAYKPLKIIYGTKEVTLENEYDWFLTHLEEYLDTHLKEKTIEETETELQKYTPKVGAKTNHKINRIITQLYHFLQEETPYHDPNGKKTDKICIFIIRILEMLGYINIISEEEEINIEKEDQKQNKTLKQWIKTIRTKISDNLKWEETNGKFKSETNDIISQEWYKEYDFTNLNFAEGLKLMRKKYW